MTSVLRKRILIISDPLDFHAAAVAHAIRSKGHLCVQFSCHDFPTMSTISLNAGDGWTERVVFRGMGGIEFVYPEQTLDTIWLRRWYRPALPDFMHAGDKEIAQRQCDRVITEFLTAVAENQSTFWVNPADQDYSSALKVHQLRTAKKIGLHVPETLVSNDPGDIKAFIESHGGVVVHKLLQPGAWRTPKRENAYVCYTSPVTLRDLPTDETLRLCPAIFQPIIPKKFEVRTVCFGDHFCSVQIDSQSDKRAIVDWRAGQWYVNVKPYSLPKTVADGIRKFLRAINVVHASVDFIVTPNGEHVFLEANVQGAFLWIEDRAREPILDIFSDFLISARRDFHFENRGTPRVSLADFWSHWEHDLSAEARKHVIADASISVLESG